MIITATTGPPVAICNRCGRTTWAQASIGSDDRMDHSTGGRCGGRFIATGSIATTAAKTNASQSLRAANQIAAQHVSCSTRKGMACRDSVRAKTGMP